MRLAKYGFSMLVLALACSASGSEGGQRGHFHPKGKLPSRHTVALQEKLRKTLPLADRDDFAENDRGFIAAPDFKQIMADAGHVAWDMGRYDFLLQGQEFDSVHPSLQRQAILNMAYGLYEVIPGIYQVRGFDLANISFIKGDTGWIVFDPLTAQETARAALKFVNEQLGERPVVAVVYSHSHADHFGGVRGVVDEADVRSGKVKIIAPIEFMDHAVSENVYAGNAMSRRLFFQYGVLLPASPFGHVDQSIGKNVAAGNLGLIPPTVIIEDAIEEMTIDGVKMIFQNTPGTEAPAEMNTYFPDLKAFWAAENITGTIHNIYTLRGALVRDALAWSKFINEALYLFGREAEVMFASHSWPRWGNDRVQEVIRGQRDMYAHLNNQVLHLANQGVTIKGAREPAAAVVCTRLSRLVRAQQPRCDQPLPRVLGRQSHHAGSPVAGGFGAAVRRDDGRCLSHHRQGQGAVCAGQVPPRHGDPEQACARRALRPGGQGPARRQLRADRLPVREPQRPQQLPGRGP
jgi:alkyl sulfatase BDS1-like metallo-beta-lactamase superfamily hydrolase